MGWLHELQSESNEWLERTGLPRRVLRHLIFAHEIGVGSQVLIAGCRDGGLVHFFDQLGFSVVGLEESAGRQTPIAGGSGADQGMRRGGDEGPSGQWPGDRVGRAGPVNPQPSTVDPPPFTSHQFDLVLVSALGVYARTLFSGLALKTTAQLLACVRPGGYLAILARYERTAFGDMVGHTGACFTRHLAHFPGSISTAEFPERRIPQDTLKWLSARRSYGGFVAASTACPRTPISRADWVRWAQTASATPAEFCCEWSLPSAGGPAGRPAA